MPQHFDRPRYLWLYIGVLSVGAVLGYMVGASNSPVVGTAIPSVFGLVVLAIGAIKDRGRPATSGGTEVESEERRGMNHLFSSFHSARPLGIMLTIFSVTYFAALLGGTEVRAASIKNAPPHFPWPNAKPPANVEDALEWLAVQQQLIAYGYSPEQVQALYALPRAQRAQLTSYLPMLGQAAQPGALGTHMEPQRSPLVDSKWIPVIERFDPSVRFEPKKEDAPRK